MIYGRRVETCCKLSFCEALNSYKINYSLLQPGASPVVRPQPHPHRNASVMNDESSLVQFSDNPNGCGPGCQVRFDASTSI